jgi:DNA-binding MarR family transcriptional regulator
VTAATEPVQDEPVQDEPVQDEPVQDEPVQDEPVQDEPRWLDERESQAWRALIHLVTLLPQALDRQLRDDAGIGHVYYMILALVSEAPGQRMRLSELAAATGTSLSRLSHALDALEARGWVDRCPTQEGRRGAVARLTDEGRRVLQRIAPGHVAEVRRLVLDPLTPAEVEELGRLAGRVLANVR